MKSKPKKKAQGVSVVVRDLDADLVRRARSVLALEGKTMKDFVIEALKAKSAGRTA